MIIVFYYMGYSYYEHFLASQLQKSENNKGLSCLISVKDIIICNNLPQMRMGWNLGQVTSCHSLWDLNITGGNSAW